MNDEIVDKIKNHVASHQIDAKAAINNSNDIHEILNSIRKNIVISEQLYMPRYRKDGVVGKIANYILEKFYRITRKIIFGSLSSQDSINYALLEAIEKLDKKITNERNLQ